MLWGYARIAAGEDHAHGQVVELHQAHVSPGSVVIESATSPTDARELEQLLTELDVHDVLVVTELTRLGATVADIVQVGDELARRQVHLRVLRPDIDTRRDPSLLTAFSALSRLEGDVPTGEPALPETRGVGRPRRLTDQQIDEARRLHDDGETAARIAERFNIPRTTVYGYLRR